MKKIAWFALLLLFISGCSYSTSSDDESEKVSDNHANEIQSLKEELKLVKVENKSLEQKLADFSSDLQLYDRFARNIMDMILDKNYEGLKSDYGAKFKEQEGNIIFDGLDDVPFPVEFAELPMYFGYYNPQNEFTEIAYYLYDTDRKYQIVYKFDKSNSLEHIYVGDV